MSSKSARLHDPLAVAVVLDLAAAVAGDLRRVAFDLPARLVRRVCAGEAERGKKSRNLDS